MPVRIVLIGIGARRELVELRFWRTFPMNFPRFIPGACTSLPHATHPAKLRALRAGCSPLPEDGVAVFWAAENRRPW